MIVAKKGKALDIYKQKSLLSIEYAITQIKQSKLAPFVQNLYLYGSCARNEQDYDSDVDLLLELSPNIDKKLHFEDMLMLKSKVVPVDDLLPEVDLKIEIGDKWKNNSMLYYQNIRKEGIQIWKKP